MKWIPIDPNDIPEGEVLAANFDPNTYGYKEKIIGKISTAMGTSGKDRLLVENDHETLYHVTHYIIMDQYDI